MKNLLSPLRALKRAVKGVLQPPRYFRPQSVDFRHLLPPPPPDDSPAVRKEIELLLEAQGTRTSEEEDQSRHEAENLNLYLFQPVLGSHFTEANLPFTHALFKHVDKNVDPVVDALKIYWHRSRPYEIDRRIRPPVNLPVHGSYPSGHAFTGYLHALILAQLVPDLKERIMARGRQIGDNRSLSGVHFPGDIEAGRMLAEALLPRLMASPKFQADLARAKAELATFRGKT